MFVKVKIKICYECKHKFSISEICLNGKCKSCMIKYKKIWYEKNKNQIRKKQDIYRLINKEKLRIADKLWRQNNREKNQSRIAKWAKENPLRRLESQQRRRARKLGSQVIKITPEILKSRLEVFGGVCSYCGGSFEHWDHLKPLELGGPHIPSNLRPACAKCNTKKGITFPKIWLKSI